MGSFLLSDAKLVPQQDKTPSIITVFLTFVPAKLIFTVSICAVVKAPLQCVHLSAENVPEGLHLCQLFPQTVSLLFNSLQMNIQLKLHEMLQELGLWRQRLILTLKEDAEVVERPLAAEVRDSREPWRRRLLSDPQPDSACTQKTTR